MKIGIVGSGQLGMELFYRLNSQRHVNAYVYSRKNGFDAKRLEVAKEIVRSNDIVINCAAMTDVDECETHHQDAIEANVTLPQNLALLCQDNGVRFIHISTDFVYGNNNLDITDGALEETDPCNPINFYGETKLIADNYIERNNEEYLILRPSWLFGISGKNNFIYKIIEKIKSKIEPLSVIDDQFGVPTSTSLVASIIEFWIDGKLENGLYNVRNAIDSDGCPSRYAIASYVRDALKSHCEIKRCSSDEFIMKAKRQKNSFLSIDHLQSEMRRREIEKPRKLKGKNLEIPCWKDAINEYINEIM